MELVWHGKKGPISSSFGERYTPSSPLPPAYHPPRLASPAVLTDPPPLPTPPPPPPLSPRTLANAELARTRRAQQAHVSERPQQLPRPVMPTPASPRPVTPNPAPPRPIAQTPADPNPSERGTTLSHAHDLPQSRSLSNSSERAATASQANHKPPQGCNQASTRAPPRSVTPTPAAHNPSEGAPTLSHTDHGLDLPQSHSRTFSATLPQSRNHTFSAPLPRPPSSRRSRAGPSVQVSTARMQAVRALPRAELPLAASTHMHKPPGRQESCAGAAATANLPLSRQESCTGAAAAFVAQQPAAESHHHSSPFSAGTDRAPHVQQQQQQQHWQQPPLIRHTRSSASESEGHEEEEGVWLPTCSGHRVWQNDLPTSELQADLSELSERSTLRRQQLEQLRGSVAGTLSAAHSTVLAVSHPTAHPHASSVSTPARQLNGTRSRPASAPRVGSMGSTARAHTMRSTGLIGGGDPEWDSGEAHARGRRSGSAGSHAARGGFSSGVVEGSRVGSGTRGPAEASRPPGSQIAIAAANAAARRRAELAAAAAAAVAAEEQYSDPRMFRRLAGVSPPVGTCAPGSPFITSPVPQPAPLGIQGTRASTTRNTSPHTAPGSRHARGAQQNSGLWVEGGLWEPAQSALVLEELPLEDGEGVQGHGLCAMSAADAEAAAEKAVQSFSCQARNTKAQEPCPICLEVMDIGLHVRALGCGHTLHHACLVQLLWGGKPSCVCPICRSVTS